MDEPVIFLDIDGVLNRHRKLPSGYCGIDRDKADLLNIVLGAVPESKLVISSAWRYMLLGGEMTVNGFEYLLLVNGVRCKGRIHGFTQADEKVDPADQPDHFDELAWRRLGLQWRADQIRRYVAEHNIGRFVVLDDLDLSIENLLKTKSYEGLTTGHVVMSIAVLKGAANGKPA